MAQVQKNTIIADRYAEALVEIAKGEKLTYERISSDLAIVEDTLSQSVDLDEVLKNPLISIEDKKEIINKVFSSEIDPLMVNFLKVLVDKDRFSTLREVIISFNIFLDKINNISRVKVTSAVELSQDAKNRLKEKL